MYAYDIATNTWTTRSQLPRGLEPRFGRDTSALLPAPNGTLYAVSDEAIASYDPASDAWTVRTQIPTPRRFSYTVLVGDGRMLLGAVRRNNVHRRRTEQLTPPHSTRRRDGLLAPAGPLDGREDLLLQMGA